MSCPLNPNVLRAHAVYVDQVLASLRREQLTPEGNYRRAGEILEDLVNEHDASRRFYGGTHSLRMAGLQATCTAGGIGLLENWVAAARRKIAALEATDLATRPKAASATARRSLCEAPPQASEACSREGESQ